MPDTDLGAARTAGVRGGALVRRLAAATEAAAPRRFAVAAAQADERDARAAAGLLALLMLGAAASVLLAGRGLTFYYDEWAIVVHRREWDLGTFLTPHNEHLHATTILLFKTLFAVVGLDAYGPYRAVVVAAHLLVAALVYVHARRRLTPWLALVPATLVLFLGAGWENVFWPFQVGLLLSVAAGLAALLALERGDRRGDVLASVLVALALVSSTFGVPVAAAVSTELLFRRRSLRHAWIAALPVACYAAWLLTYARGTRAPADLGLVPRFASEMIAASGAGLVGSTLLLNGAFLVAAVVLACRRLRAYGVSAPLARVLAGTGILWIVAAMVHTHPVLGAALYAVVGRASAGHPVFGLVGSPLVLVAALGAAAALVLRRLRRYGGTARLASLGAAAATLWVLTAAFRAEIGGAGASRYAYVGSVLLALIGVELLRGATVTRRILVSAWILTALAVLSELEAANRGRDHLRSYSNTVSASLTALELVGRDALPSYRPAPQHAPDVQAEAYFAAVDAYGSPAGTATDLASAPEEQRRTADAVLLEARPSRVDRASDARLRRSAGTTAAAPSDAPGSAHCVSIGAGAKGRATEVAVSGSRVTLRSDRATSLRVQARLFGPTYHDAVQAELPSGGASVLVLPTAVAGMPWDLRLRANARLEVCPAARVAQAHGPAS